MRIFLFALALIISPMSLHATEVSIAPVPDWVVLAPPPAADPSLVAQSQDGVHYLLSESRIKMMGETTLVADRLAMQVTDRSGLERAATIQREFDPAAETLALMRLVIIRDGQEIDQTARYAPDVFRREGQLEAGIVTGTLTATYNLPDVRVGDIVDFAFLYTTKSYVPGAPFAQSKYLDYSVPVEMARVTIDAPTGTALNVAALPQRVQHRREEGARFDRWIWELPKFAGLQEEERSVYRKDGYALLMVSSDVDWSGLTAALGPRYTADQPLTPEWDARVAAIADKYPTPAGRAIAALRLVQEHIRYVSLSIGEGGYFARPPQEVITAGFGDCKDKSLLLVTVLKRLGITADVALTDLDEGNLLPDAVPDLTVFDHMIVRAQIKGRDHWFDPTGYDEGGDLAHASTPGYGYALPVTPVAQKNLVPMTRNPGSAWLSEVTESFDFGLLGVWLTVDATFKGEAANAMRARQTADGTASRTKEYLAFYAERYPGIRTVVDLAFSDDPMRNIITQKERYFLPAPALFQNDLRQNFVFAAEDFAGYLPRTLVTPRRGDLLIGQPRHYRHKIVVTNGPIDFIPPDPISLENAAFKFNYSGTAQETGAMEMQWEYDETAYSVGADQAAAIAADVRKLGENWQFTWDLTPEE
ncbi:MAG: DUF3857 domain-containing transglutaminase family protein [Microgenomates group bacterium]